MTAQELVIIAFGFITLVVAVSCWMVTRQDNYKALSEEKKSIARGNMKELVSFPFIFFAVMLSLHVTIKYPNGFIWTMSVHIAMPIIYTVYHIIAKRYRNKEVRE